MFSIYLRITRDEKNWKLLNIFNKTESKKKGKNPH